MAGQSTTLTKSFVAEGAIAARRIVKFGATDDAVTLAVAAGDLLIGVSSEMPVVSGEPCDVHLAGIAEVVAGAAVTRGQRLGGAPDGKAIPSAAAGHKVVGIAMASGVDGDIIPILLSQSII